jgi:hypothetical protein
MASKTQKNTPYESSMDITMFTADEAEIMRGTALTRREPLREQNSLA